MPASSGPAGSPSRVGSRAATRVAILLLVGPVAVAVLEVQAQVLDRFGVQLGPDQGQHGGQIVAGHRQLQGGRCGRVGRGDGQHLAGAGGPPGQQLLVGQIGVDVDRVHRLAGPGITGVVARQLGIGVGQFVVQPVQEGRAQSGGRGCLRPAHLTSFFLVGGGRTCLG
jgi:hypothetical protein